MCMHSVRGASEHKICFADAFDVSSFSVGLHCRRKGGDVESIPLCAVQPQTENRELYMFLRLQRLKLRLHLIRQGQRVLSRPDFKTNLLTRDECD